MLKVLPTITIASLAFAMTLVPAPNTAAPDGFSRPKAISLAAVKEKPSETTQQSLEMLPLPAEQANCLIFTNELYKYDWNPQIMLAIAHAESNCHWRIGDTQLEFQANGRTYGYSIGFLQYRILPGRESCESVTIAQYVACTYGVYQRQGYRAWSTFNDGSYLRYL